MEISRRGLFAGESQGSILGPLLFLIFINDIDNEIGSCIHIFADDASLFLIVDYHVSSAERLNADLIKISKWAETCLVTFNPYKTESLISSRKIKNTYSSTLLYEDISSIGS